MGAHRAPAPTRPPRLWLALMGAACAGILVPPVVIAAQAVAPRPVAERLSLTPERAAEPMGHGGPLSAEVTSKPASDLEVGGDGASALVAQGLPPIVRQSFVRDGTPSHAQPTAAHVTTPASSPTGSTGQGIATPDETTPEQTVPEEPKESTAAGTAAGATTASATASPTTTRPTWTRSACQWRCRTGTPPATQTTTTEATATTEETTSTEVKPEEPLP